MSLTFFGLHFHLYGLLIAIAILVGLRVAEFFIKKEKILLPKPKFLFFCLGLGAFVGARIWHVVTTFDIYRLHPALIWQVWRGGLSILGLIAGLIISLQFYYFYLAKIKHQKVNLGPIFDILAFSLPTAQIIGRLANFVNQELYGPPSHLPWAIYIDPAHRLAVYERFAYFQPLFAYEMIGLAAFLMVAFYLYYRRQLKFGENKYFLWYLLFYGVLRFNLDFYRLDKAIFPRAIWGQNLGLNQLILIPVIVWVAFYLLRKTAQRS